ncbi:TonB-dependent receptor [Thermaurantimonas aggregans]|nr:TonB-dependent receptor [Thermaurantimonas aggregans]MCX8148414.1 TonB-dependent receptor [Thermaurantimonas aggregans]
MKRILVLIMAVFATNLSAQKKVTLSGYVKDASNGESLVGVNIFESGKSAGTATNEYGYYALNLPPGKYIIVYQYIGYNVEKREVNLIQNTRLDIRLKPEAQQLGEVVVSTERADKNVTSVEMSTTKLDVKEIARVPQLLGEVDIIRTLTLMPGITTVGEGANGFNVRGGNIDQNLVLLDESPLYNSTHLFGFFSIINADATKDVKVYKGGIPAEFGGRLSSVVDIRQREGNDQRFSTVGGIGTLSSRFTVEGPIVKEKASYLVSGRRSYADLFLRLSPDSNINNNILYFYDLNTKINYRINDRHRVYLSGYFGRDVLGIRNLVNFNWGNITGTVRWNWVISDRLFSNTTFVASNYDYSFGTPEEEEFSFKLQSQILNYNFGQKFTFFRNNKLTEDFGFNVIYYDFMPANVTGTIPVRLQNEYAVEPSVFYSAEWKAATRFTVQYGLRYSMFYNLGPYNLALYNNPDFPQEGEIIDVVPFKNGEIIRQFTDANGLEPRIGVNYLLSDESSVKASYNRMRQYIHLISNTTSALPIDLWRPSGRYIQPATADQVAVGYFRNFKNNMYETSIEVFYKDMRNLVDYRDGADLFFNERIETQLVSGLGRAYGMELLIRKNSGKLTGWIAYTLSRSERLVRGNLPGATINQGNWYRANFDRPHDLAIVGNYQWNQHWETGFTFIYQTGRPFTIPYGRFETEGLIAPYNPLRNNGRIPDFHRLDISATYFPKSYFTKKWKGYWSFGAYNVYNRRNAFSVYLREVEDQPNQTEAIRLAILGSIIPYVTYNFKF